MKRRGGESITTDHHPPRIYLDETWCIVSSATLHHARLLAGEGAKALVRDALRILALRYHLGLRAWVILDDHYHLLLRTGRGQDLPRFFAQLHGGTSRQINLWDAATGRQVWHNYWDSCIRTEADLWTRFDYVHHNPVRHGYVRQPEDWPFSSYPCYLRTKGEDWLHYYWMRYPVIDHLEGDGFDRPAGQSG